MIFNRYERETFKKMLGVYEPPKMSIKIPNNVPNFLALYNNFFMDRVSGEKLLDATTQAYWHSMNLSKERLRENGLTMEVQHCKKDEYSDVKMKKEFNKHGQASKFMQNVKTKRIFYKDGRKIYSGDGREVCQTDLLESVIDGDNATCPNCGNPGKLSGFIDGCDYCNAKFTVKDLEQKVSGVSFREDVPVKIKSFAQNLNSTIRNVLIGVPLGIILIMSLIGMFQFAEGNIKSATDNIFTGLGFGVTGICIGGFLAGVVSVVSLINNIQIGNVVKNFGERVTYSQMQGEKIDDFFVQDFAENLEWKLKSIFLTNGMEKIDSFVKCDITALETIRSNVVDSSMTSLQIRRFETIEDYYEVNAVAVMRNYSYIEGSIIPSTEEFKVVLTCKKDVVESPVWALRQHVCPKCGSSIDLFAGGICEYCDEKLDYTNEGWVIRDIIYIGSQKSPYPELAYKIIKVYIIMLGIFGIVPALVLFM